MSVSGSHSITLNTALTPSISWSTKNVIVESISLETEIVTPWWQIHSILPFALATSESVLGDGIGTSPCVWSSTDALRVSILQIVHLTNRQQFSMVCTLINHGNDISRMGMIIAMIKTQMNSNVQIAIANSNVHSNVQNSNETTSGFTAKFWTFWLHCYGR